MTLSESELRALVAHLPDHVSIVDGEGRVLWVNRLEEAREQPLIGRRAVELVDESQRETAGAALERCLHQGEPGYYEVLAARRDGYTTWFGSRVVPLPPADDGSPRAMILSRDVTEGRRAELALAHSEARFRSLLESLPQIVAAIDRARRMRYVNRDPPTDTGLTREAVIGLPVETMVREREAGAALCERCFETGEIGGGEFTSASGARRLRAQVVPMPPGERGELQALVIVSDITEQARAEEHRELLLAELDHRVKNTLATVMAVAEQTLARAETLDGFRETFLGRTRALARTHEALAASRWSGIDLSGLVDLVVGPFTDGSAPLAAGGANPSLPPAIVTPLAIVLHELSTNAAKYGAIAQEGGALVLHSATESGSLVLRWEEHGVPEPAVPPREGLGLRLVRGLLEHELGGEMTLTVEPDLRICRLVVPLGDGR